MPRLRFDRNELAGSFGDLGTDLPLLVGLIPAAHLDPCAVLITYGVLQILTGLLYGLPMAVQPLKAMAVIVITNNLSQHVLSGASPAITAPVLHGAGLAIGVAMLVLAVSGLLDGLARAVPRCVVRGLQMGLGLNLARIALEDFVPAHGPAGYYVAAAGFAVMLALAGNRRLPAGLVLIALGLAYAFLFRISGADFRRDIGPAMPQAAAFGWSDILTGVQLLVLPQLALSLGNSVIATAQTVKDLFPEKAVSVRRIGITYGVMNIIAPWTGGVPVCHGCGGLAGHYAFGARTGGSVVLYGSYYLLAGLFFSRGFGQLVEVFPKPILGVVLLFEAMALMRFVVDEAGEPRGFAIALLVAVLAFALPQGYIVGLIVGMIAWYVPNRFGTSEK
jgi:MFS superfamily sulfate permease-like transporter